MVIGDFHDALVEKYGKDAVRKQSRSVNVDFGVVIDADDNTDYRIVSVDVVPAFAAGDDYEIPDDDTGKWIKTNPEIHARRRRPRIKPFRMNGRAWCGWSNIGTTMRDMARSRSSRLS